MPRFGQAPLARPTRFGGGFAALIERQIWIARALVFARALREVFAVFQFEALAEVASQRIGQSDKTAVCAANIALMTPRLWIGSASPIAPDTP